VNLIVKAYSDKHDHVAVSFQVLEGVQHTGSCSVHSGRRSSFNTIGNNLDVNSLLSDNFVVSRECWLRSSINGHLSRGNLEELWFSEWFQRSNELVGGCFEIWSDFGIELNNSLFEVNNGFLSSLDIVFLGNAWVNRVVNNRFENITNNFEWVLILESFVLLSLRFSFALRESILSSNSSLLDLFAS